MRDRDNIMEVSALKPDYMGFIFYPPSPRYAGDVLMPEDLEVLSPETKRVGVFVDAGINEILRVAKTYRLDTVQLHGNESVSYVEQLTGNDFQLVKVISGNTQEWDNEYLARMEELIDFWLIDSRGEVPGGTGKVFNRSILKSFDFKKPVMLSGGLDAIEVNKILNEDHPAVFAIDLNSKMEDQPGFKNVGKIKELLKTIR